MGAWQHSKINSSRIWSGFPCLAAHVPHSEAKEIYAGSMRGIMRINHERRNIMGLTIQYSLKTRGSEARARKLVQALHRTAHDLPFKGKRQAEGVLSAIVGRDKLEAWERAC